METTEKQKEISERLRQVFDKLGKLTELANENGLAVRITPMGGYGNVQYTVETKPQKLISGTSIFINEISQT